jgi:UDP-N-acetylglucosamine/UDP-N-acetyl-alpha-D-glucosaminouronate 4-epimerase
VGRYLVTGGAGFIGSSLVRQLLAKGENVRVLDNLATGKESNLAEVIDDIEFLKGDLCESGDVGKAVRDVDFVLHQAAIPSVPRSVDRPLESHAANATGTLMLLHAARQARVGRLVYASSSSVYGASEELPKRESLRPEPLSPYAVSKLAAEQYCMVFHRLYGLETVALRYFNVFGPRQDPSSQYSGVISRFIDCIVSGQRPVIYGDGEQTRDFTYVENVADVNLAACHAPRAPGRVYNVGCGQRTSLNQLWKTMAGLAGVDKEPVYEAPRVGDVRHSQADVRLAAEELSYQPKVSLAEGLELSLSFYGALGSGGRA